MSEITIKLSRLSGLLDHHNLDGLLLTHRNNFAWITGGCDNRIANNAAAGVASIYVTRNTRVCLTNTIEGPRFAEEELAGTGIEVIAAPWEDRAAQTQAARQIIGDARIAADSEDFGLPTQPFPADDFARLRWSLLPEEIERYKEGGRRTSAAIEQACHDITPGMAEHQIAGILDACIHARGLNPVVTLVAADGRIARFRHPIPTDTVCRDYAMLVTCAEYGGLISNVTRFVSFKPLSDEIRRRQQAVVNIDAAVNLATRPGRTLGEIFADLQAAYAASGFADEWRLHHQGGSTGYAGRDVFAVPGSPVQVLDNQAFAWNPSITGVKSEDTILVTASGIEILTPCANAWPTLAAQAGDQTLARPDILVR